MGWRDGALAEAKKGAEKQEGKVSPRAARMDIVLREPAVTHLSLSLCFLLFYKFKYLLSLSHGFTFLIKKNLQKKYMFLLA